ncbi:endonuclease toxin domain-containing protein [Pseudooctadecabacter jejudonensis]|uniref:endonuclease toxin domain-containing protein n=1 Tax=Pseudooctadecabacter jejudonensis TaxID=1391910 RepID=UPI003899B6EE
MEKPGRFRTQGGLNEHLGRHKSGTGPDLRAGMIDSQRLLLAVPRGTNRQQIIQIERAIEYASDNGVILQVRFIQ